MNTINIELRFIFTGIKQHSSACNNHLCKHGDFKVTDNNQDFSLHLENDLLASSGFLLWQVL